MREVIKDRLSIAMKNALPVPLTIEVDMSGALKLVESLCNKAVQATEIRVTPTSVLVKAVAQALRMHPVLNSRFVNEQAETPDEINVGVAVALEDGLVVPVIRNTDRKTVIEIADTISVLAEKH